MRSIGALRRMAIEANRPVPIQLLAVTSDSSSCWLCMSSGRRPMWTCHASSCGNSICSTCIGQDSGSVSHSRTMPPMPNRCSCGKICANGHSISRMMAKLAWGSNQAWRSRVRRPSSISARVKGATTAPPSSAPSALVIRSILEEMRLGSQVWKASMQAASSVPATSATSVARPPDMRGCSDSTTSAPNGT
ncbi:hypothetical protein D3C72_1565450 [compost metagenome]